MARRHASVQNLKIEEHDTMATTRTADETQNIATGANGAGDAPMTDIVELNISDPNFMATAYDTYAALREQGRVSTVQFSAGEAAQAQDGPRQEMFNRDFYFVTHYDVVVATLLDDRFSVDPRSQLTPEQREKMPEGPEEFRPLARSIIAIDPPDHTRIRKLVQPSFTGRGMEAMRPSIQKTVARISSSVRMSSSSSARTMRLIMSSAGSRRFRAKRSFR